MPKEQVSQLGQPVTHTRSGLAVQRPTYSITLCDGYGEHREGEAVGFVGDVPDAQARGSEFGNVAAMGGLVQAGTASRCGVEARVGDYLVEFGVALG